MGRDGCNVRVFISLVLKVVSIAALLDDRKSVKLATLQAQRLFCCVQATEFFNLALLS